jgi:hypothetical protein
LLIGQQKGQFMTQSPGAAAHPPNSIDWAAYEHLQKRTQTARLGFNLDCVERGLDRLLAEPDRATSGTTLAMRLEHDARKQLKKSRAAEVLTDTIELLARPDDPTEFDLEEIEVAVTRVSMRVIGLDGRLRAALAAKVAEVHAGVEAGDLDIGVGDRQARNLVSNARLRLWEQPELQEAFFAIRKAFDRWRHLTATKCAPLTLCWGQSA